MPMSPHVALQGEGRRLVLAHQDRTWVLSAIWLRERAPDADTLDERTGQRLIEAADLPLSLAIEHADIAGDRLSLTFSDGHRTAFAIDPLLASATTVGGDADARFTLWDATLSAIPEAGYAAAVNDDGALWSLLDKLRHYGFVRVSGVPFQADGMQRLIDRIGPLRRTNWGGIADVKSVPQAYDLTMTRRGLEPHTDNPYRDPIPGYIWLHCLSNAAEGGDSTLVDGFMAAQCLKQDAPDAFDCLTRFAPTFRYVDDSTFLESEGPLIELDSAGRLHRVRYSNRTERIAAHDAESLERYYAARQRFYRLITSDALTVRLKLDPGQMLIMDNYRLLHGRTPFRLEGGVRHMRQGYVDRDSVSSRRHVLEAAMSRATADADPSTTSARGTA